MSELPNKGDLIAGKYTVEGVLGQGGMGAVFEVCHRLTGKHFAVKWLLPALSGQSDAVRRFMREAQVAGRVDHPNVVEVYDVGQEGNSFYMVMELLQGESLAARIDRVRRLSADEACRILIPVMHGLSVAHAAGVIHRDLKPDNIYLCRTPLGTEVSKVLDFGISKMSALAGEVSANVTRFGLVIGTPQYMSPEQLRGEPVDHRTDIYALGVILYEMLGGSQPYPGASFADLVLMIAHEDPKPLSKLAPGLPGPIVELVHRAMSRDPNGRFQTVEEMGRALAALSNGIEFAADTGDPVRLSSSQRVVSAQRSQTPFATELEGAQLLSDSELDLGRPAPLPMIAGVGVAAAAVIALGAAAYMLLQAPQQVVQTPPAAPPVTSTAAQQPIGTTADPQVGADVLNPLLPPGGGGTELPVPNTVRIGPELPGGDNPNPGGGATGAYDPAGLGDQGNAQHIRLGSRSSSHAVFGSGVSAQREPRSKRAKERAERRGEASEDSAREADESPRRHAPTAPSKAPSKFRAGEGQGMTAEEF